MLRKIINKCIVLNDVMKQVIFILVYIVMSVSVYSKFIYSEEFKGHLGGESLLRCHRLVMKKLHSFLRKGQLHYG